MSLVWSWDRESVPLAAIGFGCRHSTTMQFPAVRSAVDMSQIQVTLLPEKN